MTDNKKRAGRLTLQYAGIQAGFNMGYCCLVNFASVFLLYRGFSNSEVGITLTMANLLSILSQPVLASFADKNKHIQLRRMVSTLIAASMVLAAILWLAPTTVLPTAVLYLVLVSVLSNEMPLITSMSMEHINSGIPLNFGLARGFGSLSFAVLSFFMGFVAEAVGGWVILPAFIIISGIAVLLNWFFPTAKPAEAVSEAKAAPAQAGGEGAQASSLWQFARKNLRYVITVFALVLIFFCNTLINTFTIQIVRHLGGDSGDMGIAIAIAALVELPAMALFPLVLKKLKSAGLILKLAGVFFIVKCGIAFLAPNMAWFYVSQVFQSVSYGMFIPASVYYANRIIQGADRVKGQSIMGMVVTLSAMLASAVGGFMLDSSGGVPFMLGGGLAVTCAGLVLLLLVAPKDNPGEDPVAQ